MLLFSPLQNKLAIFVNHLIWPSGNKKVSYKYARETPVMVSEAKKIIMLAMKCESICRSMEATQTKSMV
jgi:hypothetical protein